MILPVAAGLTGVGVLLATILANRGGASSPGGVVPLSPKAPGVTKAPTGKGVFIRDVKHAGNTPADLVAWVAKLRLDFVILQALWQNEHTDTSSYKQLPDHVRALQANGTRVWLFGWVRSEEQRRDYFARFMGAAATKLNADGYIINAEAPYYGQSKFSAARDLIERCRRSYPGRIGFTSYGGGYAMHPSFPWANFSTLDFGMPQIYDTHHRLGKDYPTRAMEQWAKLYGADNIIPIWGASNAHTPQQMIDIISRTPFAPGCAWWDFYWLTMNAKRAQVVTNFVLGSPQVGADTRLIRGAGGDLWAA
ncbi:MAG: hypothetical protein KC468_19790 [Myxococcales bacterium]|nr:hypothetical protein [Myxococcales bacterium]